jgi:hypothetical protein
LRLLLTTCTFCCRWSGPDAPVDPSPPAGIYRCRHSSGRTRRSRDVFQPCSVQRVSRVTLMVRSRSG